MSSRNDEWIKVIGPLAIEIHANNSDELIGDLPAVTDITLPNAAISEFKIDGKSVHFASIEARNSIVATYRFMENREEFFHDDPRWLDVALELWRNEIGKSDSAAGRLLAFVHEVSDIFNIATKVIERKPADVWNVLCTIESALPHLADLPPEGIVRLVAVQHKNTKNDYAGGMLYHKLEEKLAELPNTCRKIHLLLKSDITDTTISLYPVPLIALAKSYPEDAFKLVVEDIDSSNPLLKNAALWAVGRLLVMSLVKGDSQSIATNIIINNMSHPVEEIRQTAIRAAAYTAHVTNAFDESITKRGEAGDPNALSSITEAIYMNTAEMKAKPIFENWLKLLCKLPHTHGSFLQHLDVILSQLMSDELGQQLVISWLTEWGSINAEDIPRDKSIAEIFNATSHELANRPALLSQLITDWLLADNRKLASAAAGLLSHLGIRGFRNPEFDVSRLDNLENSDLLFLARRTLGFVFSEDHLLSLTISLLKTRETKQRVFGLAYGLFVNEIGKDYPSSTIKALESAKSLVTEKETLNFYSSAITEIRNRIDTLNALPRLAELRPPPRIQREFTKARDKQMRLSMEEAQKGSIIRQLCTEIPLKAGIGSFSFRDGVYGEPTYMQSISHSVSLPMREASDSIGYALHLFSMRIARRENP
ncbi:hypothetical protein GALL_44440 [mine drainage metagenome]|uniref:Uncharacterized protein n=1 Tax=mine drainage metagenome TaxID=410659 RepID=A0A1J5T1H1_9ZZZZ